MHAWHEQNLEKGVHGEDRLNEGQQLQTYSQSQDQWGLQIAAWLEYARFIYQQWSNIVWTVGHLVEQSVAQKEPSVMWNEKDMPI